ncbi:MAG TPA: PKD domain-containing protein [Bacteroidales bacterium]|nr:PKD domain-containing protein [Bacteroidales bacterium]HRX95878.1 PKD domain-containing protein [Bacteroidales bacterium]
MRKFVLIIGSMFLLQSLIVNKTFSQDVTLSVSGIILDTNIGAPVPNHDVHIEVTGGGATQVFELQTDFGGFFFKDSIIANVPGSVIAQVYDCNEVLHELEEPFSPANTNLFFDFQICADTTTECLANYIWGLVPGFDYSIQFIDLSMGNIEDWLWDFGDGNTSSEQNPVHFYNAPGLYNVCLTTSSADSSCFDTYCEYIQVDSIQGDCENWFIYDSPDYLTFNFEGFSIPEAEVWLWDFGDGGSDSGPIVSHTYEPGGPDFYNVTLITIHSTPSGGDSCVAVSSQTIFMGNDCQAYFEAEQNTQDPFTWNFTDLSTGSPNLWFWDFGDGSFSNDQNPQHTYNEPGIFMVCLDMISDTLGAICSDNYCDTIVINYSLQAAFNASLDTVSGQKNRYVFEDISIGNPDSWLWDFGDGTTSSEQNPVHIFDQSGSYQTCLTVSRTIGGQLYQDQFCLNHNTPNYFNFGGTVFLGNNPMNNLNGDTTIVDVALAYLYRKYDNSIVPADTTMFHQYGYYYFTDVREGDYMIKIELMETSEHFGQFLPGYHLHSHTWTSAHSLHLYDESTYEINVHLDPLEGLAGGPGAINGYIAFTGSDIVSEEQLQGVEIMIMDENLVALSYQKTDENGIFNFSGIPLGTYYLHAESAGFYTVTEKVVLNDNNSVVSGVSLNLHTEILDVPELISNSFHLGSIYPNPASGNVYINLESFDADNYTLKIMDVAGKTYAERKEQFVSGEHILQWDVSNLPAGFYLIAVTPDKSGQPEIRKFIK